MKYELKVYSKNTFFHIMFIRWALCVLVIIKILSKQNLISAKIQPT